MQFEGSVNHSLKAWSLHPSLALLLSSPSSLPSFTALPIEPGLMSIFTAQRSQVTFLIPMDFMNWLPSSSIWCVSSCFLHQRKRGVNARTKTTLITRDHLGRLIPNLLNHSCSRGCENLANILEGKPIRRNFSSSVYPSEKRERYCSQSGDDQYDAFTSTFTTSCHTKHLF